MSQNLDFNEREKLMDSLSSQKLITDDYNSYANECAHPEVKAAFINILNEEHIIQHDMFCDMQQKGWYEVTQAQQSQIQTAANKFKL